MSADPIGKVIGRNLAQARAKTGTTEEELARAMGWSLERLQSIEKGKTRATSQELYRAAEFLAVKPSDFLTVFQKSSNVASPDKG